ncbi:PREDICTED: uncharacterized protein LOC100636408 [Amphimedon queenslandica]|uniref:Cation-dependent mannose-6-phosphate receptor n=1 Tax=Amphimedon queenslandica TaxID=400682 RepID=A0A1X7V107_AMPQE|nr:PREDICTED: uncharacterized protein LOC100636408 [Amphimedon queenslandica]|eukprot:XP_003386100.1 PREDICTED: uncharacterized protein LOC100636408 [Amphimedon queenslandica]
MACSLVLFLCLVSFLIDFSSATNCTKVSGKACQATCNGKKYDLSHVTKSAKNITDSDDGYYYLVNFCEQVKCGQNNGVAICQGKGIRYFSLGTIDSAFWTTSDSSGDFNVTIHGTTQGDGTVRTAIIMFTSGKKNSIDFNGEGQGANQNTYYFTGTYHGGSESIAGAIGWVLISVALVALVIYFIAGILFMYIVKGARGLEVIPNVNFWKSLPLLIVEGCLFVVSPCRKKFGKNEYEKI